MESTDSSSGSHQQPQLPPGFRFHPTDEELVVHYLKKKAASLPLPVTIIAEVDLYKFDPWELPAKAIFGEQEWYFFSPRDRKYPNGARPNRAATSGYWKATGTDKPVLTAGGTQRVGVKKALVFYGGKPPKGIKTNWIMHEYRLLAPNNNNNNNKSISKPPAFDFNNNNNNKKGGSLRLDDWVLCRIYKKSNAQRPVEDDILSNDVIGPMVSIGQQQNEYEEISMMMDSKSNINLHNLLPIKRAAADEVTSLYWNGDVVAPTKRFFTGNEEEDQTTTNMNMNILAHQQQATMLMANNILGDGVFEPQPYHQGPGMMNNWYT